MTVYCPCCGYDTLTAASNYEVCPICFWEDVPTTDLIMRITSNHVTLLQAQRNFLTTGACEAESVTLTRPPMATAGRVIAPPTAGVGRTAAALSRPIAHVALPANYR